MAAWVLFIELEIKSKSIEGEAGHSYITAFTTIVLRVQTESLPVNYLADFQAAAAFYIPYISRKIF